MKISMIKILIRICKRKKEISTLLRDTKKRRTLRSTALHPRYHFKINGRRTSLLFKCQLVVSDTQAYIPTYLDTSLITGGLYS